MNAEATTSGKRVLAFAGALLMLAAVGLAIGLLIYSNHKLSRRNDAMTESVERYCAGLVSDLEIARDDYRAQLDRMSPDAPPEQLGKLQATFDRGISELGSDLSDAGRAGTGAMISSRFNFCLGVRDTRATRTADIERRFATLLYEFRGLAGTIRQNEDRKRLVKTLGGLAAIAREVNGFPLRTTRP